MEDAEAPDVLNWELEAEASDVISWVFEAEAPEDALSWVLEAEAPDTLSWVSKAEAPDALSCVLEAEAPNALSWVLEAEAPNALGVAVAPVGLSRLEKLSSKSMNGKTSKNSLKYQLLNFLLFSYHRSGKEVLSYGWDFLVDHH